MTRLGSPPNNREEHSGDDPGVGGHGGSVGARVAAALTQALTRCWLAVQTPLNRDCPTGVAAMAVGARVEEALHKRALWGVPRALREWEVIEGRSTYNRQSKVESCRCCAHPGWLSGGASHAAPQNSV